MLGEWRGGGGGSIVEVWLDRTHELKQRVCCFFFSAVLTSRVSVCTGGYLSAALPRNTTNPESRVAAPRSRMTREACIIQQYCWYVSLPEIVEPVLWPRTN